MVRIPDIYLKPILHITSTLNQPVHTKTWNNSYNLLLQKKPRSTFDMQSFLWQLILLGFAATSTAIYQGGKTTNLDAVGVVRVQAGSDAGNFGSGVVLGNGKCVITAAHVVKNWEARNLKFFKNKQERGNIIRTENSVAGSSIHIHPMYDGTSDPNEEPSAYDFAVVELASAMDTSPWKVSETRGGALDLTMYGWGSISSAPATFPGELRSAVNKNSATSSSKCRQWSNIVGAICVTSSKSNSAGLNCQGDSGGPNVANNYVVGVTSGTNRICGYQTAGLLAGLSGSNQNDFMLKYQSTCGFEFGRP